MSSSQVLTERGWNLALEAYRAAKTAEAEHDRLVYLPAFNAALPDVSTMSKSIVEEDERLTRVRNDAEDVLMAIPAPTPVALLFKYLISHADERGCDGWDDLMVGEALGFIPDFPREAERP